MATKIPIEDTLEVSIDERWGAYELTLVLSSKASDDERDSLISKIRGLISDNGGELLEVSPPKEFTLAYPIQKERQGVMRTLIFKSLTNIPNIITKALKHEPALLRLLAIERPKEQPPQRDDSPRYSSLKKEDDSERKKKDETPALDESSLDKQIEGAISTL